MTMNNRGRSTTGGPDVPDYQTTPIREAAKLLALMARRFLSERANVYDVDRAIEEWCNERRKQEEANQRLGGSSVKSL